MLAAVAEASAGQASAYGDDPWSERARQLVSAVFETEVDVIPTSSGTAANALALAALTPPWGTVMCHRGSHLENDECGAPEFFSGGAKLRLLDGQDAKIDPSALRRRIDRGLLDPFGSRPAAISITQATETGATYTVDEVATLSGIARDAGLRVHMDGARFANAVSSLSCSPAELTWRAGVDLLSLGTTKNGTMTADVIVAFDRELTDELRRRAKRAGQVTAKARFQAAQLIGHVTDDLWLRNAQVANATAERLRSGLARIDKIDVVGRSTTNVTFVTMPPEIADALRADGFSFYGDRWGPDLYRLVTSFESTGTDVDAFLDAAWSATTSSAHSLVVRP